MAKRSRTPEQRERRNLLERLRYVPHPRARNPDRLQQRKAAAKAHVREIRKVTVCATCGAQPVDWHSPEHEKTGKAWMRVSALAAVGFAIHRIDTEIAACTPLCRSCHMKEDGRLDRLMRASHTIKPPKPCIVCTELAKPLRKGLCSRCYDRKRRREKEVYGPHEFLMMGLVT
jgi:hypothetical protein